MPASYSSNTRERLFKGLMRYGTKRSEMLTTYWSTPTIYLIIHITPDRADRIGIDRIDNLHMSDSLRDCTKENDVTRSCTGGIERLNKPATLSQGFSNNLGRRTIGEWEFGFAIVSLSFDCLKIAPGHEGRGPWNILRSKTLRELRDIVAVILALGFLSGRL
jgi:hypothetical protein